MNATNRPARTDQIGSSYKPAPPAAPTRLDRYLATLSPMQAGKARKALERQQGFNGQFQRRCDWAEAHYQDCSVNYERQRLYTDEDRFFAIADVTLALCDYVVWLKYSADADAPVDHATVT